MGWLARLGSTVLGQRAIAKTKGAVMHFGKYLTSLEHQIWFTVVTVVVWLLTVFIRAFSAQFLSRELPGDPQCGQTWSTDGLNVY